MLPIVYCDNPSCPLPGWPIPLPPSILPKTILFPNSMLTDISAVNVVCRHCGLWRTHRSVTWENYPIPPEEGRTAFPTVWKVELMCERCKPETPARWYLLEDSAPGASDVLTFVTRATPVLACKAATSFFPLQKL